MTIIDKIEQAVSSNPDGEAFIFKNQVISYQRFYALLCQATRQLHDSGVKPSDVIGLGLGQSPLHCIVMLALARLGAISVPLQPTMAAPLKSAIASKYAVKLVISNQDSGKVEGCDFMRLDTLSMPDGDYSLDVTDYQPKADTPFRIGLSSGTSGDPKGVLLSQGYMLDRIEKMLTECEGELRLIPMDINITIGFIFALGILTVGGTVVFPISPRPQHMINAIRRHHVTHMFLSPAQAMSMVHLLTEETIAFPELKQLRIAGASSPPKLVEMLRKKFTPNVYMAYGLSEVGGISISSLESISNWPNSSGIIKPWVKAEIVDQAGNVLPPGEAGEIRVKMVPMPSGYYKDEEKSAKAFRDGWFYTNDRGRINEQGLLFVEGRIDSSFDINGNKVDPDYMESILAKHPRVLEAVVFPLPGDNGRSVLAAAVITKSGEGKLGLRAYAKEHFGIHAPKFLFFVDDFPRNPSGKVMRREMPVMAKRIQQEQQQRVEQKPEEATTH
jgi:acyl-coenzyme A synthetase/AMP-(fatty) acid ligase